MSVCGRQRKAVLTKSRHSFYSLGQNWPRQNHYLWVAIVDYYLVGEVGVEKNMYMMWWMNLISSETAEPLVFLCALHINRWCA